MIILASEQAIFLPGRLFWLEFRFIQSFSPFEVVFSLKSCSTSYFWCVTQSSEHKLSDVVSYYNQIGLEQKLGHKQ